jgi:Cap4, dsDNA endonuclease domain
MADTKVDLPSIYELPLSETGGTDARRGFDYQDDVAAAFCLEMVASDALLQVQCETYDDITIIWQDNTVEKVEFIQVKKIDLDQLWTIAKLCQREKGNGSSILEKSLKREGCVEECIFRIVTDIDVKSELDLLTYSSDDSRRDINTPEFGRLCDAVTQKIGNFKSPKDNGCIHWLHNAYWDVRGSREALRNANIILLQDLVYHQLGEYLAPDQANKIYDKLLRKVHDAAGPEKRANPNEKIIKRDDFLDWLKAVVNDQLYPGTIGNDKLKKKMAEASLPEASISTAVEQRRQYRKERLSPTYLSLVDIEKVESDILAELHHAYSQLEAQEINDTGPQFHSRCLEILKTIKGAYSGSADTPLSFYQGYMYDITNRCLHRFSREIL